MRLVSILDAVEATAQGLQEFDRTTCFIECSRDKFAQLSAEIEEEYDLTVVEDVKMTKEKLPDQLSNVHTILLHGVRFVIHVKD